jgi:hypothetical protein
LRGLRFILKFLWHFDLQKRKAFASLRTGAVSGEKAAGRARRRTECDTLGRVHGRRAEVARLNPHGGMLWATGESRRVVECWGESRANKF